MVTTKRSLTAVAEIGIGTGTRLMTIWKQHSGSNTLRVTVCGIIDGIMRGRMVRNTRHTRHMVTIKRSLTAVAEIGIGTGTRLITIWKQHSRSNTLRVTVCAARAISAKTPRAT